MSFFFVLFCKQPIDAWQRLHVHELPPTSLSLQICDASGVDYDKVVEYTLHDTRLGKTHWSVPGPDGQRGFGGHCFPKDLQAMIAVASEMGIDPILLKAVWDKNSEMREDRDWEKMIGRAVSED